MNIIIDYGLGNLHSVLRAFERVGVESKISHDPREISQAKSLVLPGVGAFRDAIMALENANLIPLIKEHAAQGKFLLGICLGMQLLYEISYENGAYPGLGLIEGRVDKLDESLKIPHMGWNNLKFYREDAILKYINEDDFAYFVHSYYVHAPKDHLTAYTNYGAKIPAVVRKDNIYGMQFHPEKSAQTGLNLLKAYGEMIK